MTGAPELPEGEVSFLFSDIEGSTKLLERHPALFGAGIARHHELLAAAVERHGGIVFETIGDAVYAAFGDASAAVEAAATGQLALLEEDWGELGEIRVRMGVHTGPVERRDTHYFGPALYRCARLMTTAHGGQVVLSHATAELVRDALGDGVSLLDLGQHRLKDLVEPERVHQLVRAPLRREFPELRSAGGRPNNLPAEVKTFVGRREELDELEALLVAPEVRLVTLTGPGGSGKTRLALRAAGDLLDPFRDGVFLVELTPLDDAALVLPALAQALGVQETAGRPLVESLGTSLAGKELLLVLDNFEHVVGAAPELAALMSAASGVKVLVTSRVPLRIQGERELDVGPLPVPSAVQLFAERAREIRGDFTLSEENARVVAEICTRLDGLPLAIELAAARTRLLSPEGMLPRLESRLGLLTGGPADLPSRQRTLRDTIGWSYDLLDEGEQALFRRLGVFRGGAGLAAAEAVAGDGDVLAGLTALAEQSLVKTRWNDAGEPRFEMLETIAEFARERLAGSGEAAALEARHAEYFAAFAEEVERHLYTDARLPWLRRLDEDRDNFRAALSWAERNDAQVGLRILAALWLWYWTSFVEGLDWARRLLPLPSAVAPTPARAGALFTAQICAAGFGAGTPEMAVFAEEGVVVSRAVGDDRRLALTLALGPGTVEDMERVLLFQEEAIVVAERHGDPWVLAWAKMAIGLVAMLTGDPVVAGERSAEAVAGFTELGDSWSRASATMSLGFSRIQLGDLDGARKALQGSVDALLQVRDLKMANGCLIALGMAARFSGDSEVAEEHYEHALRLCAEQGDPANAPVCVEGIAASVAARDPVRAARLLGAARSLFDAGYSPTVPGFEVFYETTLGQLEGELGGELEELLAAGRSATAAGLPLAEVARV